MLNLFSTTAAKFYNNWLSFVEHIRAYKKLWRFYGPQYKSALTTDINVKHEETVPSQPKSYWRQWYAPKQWQNCSVTWEWM